MKVIKFHPDGLEFATGEPVGQIYIIGFPRKFLLYVGSTVAGAIRLDQHSVRLKQHRHPNHQLQEAYDTRGEGRMDRHVVCSCYGISRAQLRHIEWQLSITLASHYSILNEDTTKKISYRMDDDTERRVLDLIDDIMGVRFDTRNH